MAGDPVTLLFGNHGAEVHARIGAVANSDLANSANRLFRVKVEARRDGLSSDVDVLCRVGVVPVGQIGFRPIHFLRTVGLVPERHPTSGQLTVLAQDEGRQRLGFSLELQRGALRRRLLPGKSPIDLFRNQDLIGAGCALQARGGVHHVPDSRKIL